MPLLLISPQFLASLPLINKPKLSPSSRFVWCSLFLFERRLARSMAKEFVEKYLLRSDQIDHSNHPRMYKSDILKLICCVFVCPHHML